MKALIFTMTCGEGHNMIAKSLKSSFEAKGVETHITQTYGYNEKRVAQENKKYLWACKHIPRLYDYVWNKLRLKNHYTDKLPSYVKYCLPHFLNEINNVKPDIIVCTHYYASSVVSYMQKNNMIDKNILTSTILTDYCVHPYWEHSINVDYVIQALDNTTSDLIKKGFKENQILTTGMPIRDIFYADFNKDEEKEKLSMQGQKVVTIIGGGNGLGNTLKLLKNLLSLKTVNKQEEIKFVVINGKNIKNFNKINKYISKNKISNVLNLGFVTNIESYMRASDIIITRCGSSCLTECISLKVPFIMREKMILNEELNKNLFINLKCGLGMRSINDAKDKAQLLLDNPDLYSQMQKNIISVQHPYSSAKIVELLIEKTKL